MRRKSVTHYLRRGVLLLLVAGGPSPSRISAQEMSGTWSFADITFPPQIDSFFVRGVDRWPDAPSWGTVLRFVTRLDGRAQFDVYVYPVPEALRSQDDSTVVAAEFTESMEGVEQYTDQERDGVTLNIEEESWVQTEEWVGRQARYTMRRGSQARESRLLVFRRDDFYYKFRMTYERAVRKLLEEPIGRFITGALGHVVTRKLGANGD